LIRGSYAVLCGLLFSSPGYIAALETLYTPYKDGYATPSTYIGNSRTLLVSHPDSKAWVSHPIGDGAEKGVTKARLQVYVKDVVRDGKLRVFLKSAVDRLENQTRYGDIMAADSLGDSVAITLKDVQRVVNIPLGAAFLKGLAQYDGIVLEGDDGLEAELGALEGGHGALLYLTYSGASDSILVKRIAQELVQSHLPEIKGRDGVDGMDGRNGTDGEDGKDGRPGDSALVFRLLQDRGHRAYFAFDRFTASNGSRSTPDSSGNGNDLTLSANGTNLRANAPGDSVVEFLGNGYAVAPNSLSLNPYREIMLSARVKLSTDAPPDTQTLLSKGDQYEMAVIGNRLFCRFRTALGNGSWSGGYALPFGVWVTVAAGYDGRAVRTFVDGLQRTYLPFPKGPLVMESTSLFVGAANASGDRGLKGILDQVGITSYAVHSQDSLSVIPGRATMTQVVADSVAGLKSLLDQKADLGGADFTGPVSVAQAASNYGFGFATPGPGRFGYAASIGHSGTHYDEFGYNLGFTRVNDRYLYLRDDHAASIRMGYGAGGGGLEFRTATLGKAGDSLSLTNRMVVRQDGNVGIGTSSPQAKLDVNGEVRATGFFAINTGYNATPLQCVDSCSQKGGRMATVSEMYAFASGKNSNCAFLWVLDDQNIGMVALGIPMYKNHTNGACGTPNTGDVPRIELLGRNQPWNVEVKRDCGCYGIK
jgi:hypothetical protein